MGRIAAATVRPSSRIRLYVAQALRCGISGLARSATDRILDVDRYAERAEVGAEIGRHRHERRSCPHHEDVRPRLDNLEGRKVVRRPVRPAQIGVG